VFLSKGTGGRVMPVPGFGDWAGIGKGGRKEGYRDRKDRY